MTDDDAPTCRPRVAPQAAPMYATPRCASSTTEASRPQVRATAAQVDHGVPARRRHPRARTRHGLACSADTHEGPVAASAARAVAIASRLGWSWRAGPSPPWSRRRQWGLRDAARYRPVHDLRLEHRRRLVYLQGLHGRRPAEVRRGLDDWTRQTKRLFTIEGAGPRPDADAPTFGACGMNVFASSPTKACSAWSTPPGRRGDGLWAGWSG